MTAEIAVMNKEAIALAADSAVTLREEAGQKIFTSAMKLFSLSKYHPVGIMIYGNAQFMNVPWETIIKIYRSKLGEKSFNTLKDYSKDFVTFLSNENPLFPETEQDSFFKGEICGYFNHILSGISERVEKFLEGNEKIDLNEYKKIISQTITDHHNLWNNTEFLPLATKKIIKEITSKYKDFIEEAKKNIFEKIPLTKELSSRLTKIAEDLFFKFPENLQHLGTSGVVIAGFGTDDIFPSLETFLFEGKVNNFLKYERDETKSDNIDFKKSAIVVPFAQREMVDTFMQGVDPDYEAVIESNLVQLLKEYPDIIVDSMKDLDNKKKLDLKKKLYTISQKKLGEYLKGLNAYRYEKCVQSVVKVVAMLPKEDLAGMAESLVNLTSLKRKLTMEAETVGGPIDVAIISKGDGFIWIKRKHYFKPELNNQFFTNYYREDKNETE